MQILKISKLIKRAMILCVCISFPLMQGCVRAILPTSDAELVSKSINGGGSVEVQLNYVQAYANLKQAYIKCVQYKNSNDYLTVEAHLDRENKIGTFYGRPPFGTYIFKTIITPIDIKTSKLTLYTLKASLLTLNANQSILAERLAIDKARALGQDKQCNKD